MTTRSEAYDAVARALEGPAQSRFEGIGRVQRMQMLCDLLWNHLAARPSPGESHPPERPYSWLGFYSMELKGKEMTLGPSRDTPACNPIGLHGMCGKCCIERRPILVADVKTLGESYVACDPRDVSEIVVPCINADGTCDTIFDGDSFDNAAFTESDVAAIRRLLMLTELSVASDPIPLRP